MEPFTNEQIAAIEAIIDSYFDKYPELILKRLLGIKKLEIQTGAGNITLSDDGTGIVVTLQSTKVKQTVHDDGTGKIVFERIV